MKKILIIIILIWTCVSCSDNILHPRTVSPKTQYGLMKTSLKLIIPNYTTVSSMGLMSICNRKLQTKHIVQLHQISL